MKAPPKVRHLSVSTSATSRPIPASTLPSQLPSRSEIPMPGSQRRSTSGSSPTSKSPDSTPPPLSAPPLSPSSASLSFAMSDGPPNIPPRTHPRQCSAEWMYSSSAPTSGYYGSPLSDPINSPPSIPPRSPCKPKPSQAPDAPLLPPRSRPQSVAPVIPPRINKTRSVRLNAGAPDLPPRKKP